MSRLLCGVTDDLVNVLPRQSGGHVKIAGREGGRKGRRMGRREGEGEEEGEEEGEGRREERREERVGCKEHGIGGRKKGESC